MDGQGRDILEQTQRVLFQGEGWLSKRPPDARDILEMTWRLAHVEAARHKGEKHPDASQAE